jgi:hypothetical protein
MIVVSAEIQYYENLHNYRAWGVRLMDDTADVGITGKAADFLDEDTRLQMLAPIYDVLGVDNPNA